MRTQLGFTLFMKEVLLLPVFISNHCNNSCSYRHGYHWHGKVL